MYQVQQVHKAAEVVYYELEIYNFRIDISLIINVQNYVTSRSLIRNTLSNFYHKGPCAALTVATNKDRHRGLWCQYSKDNLNSATKSKIAFHKNRNEKKAPGLAAAVAFPTTPV